MSDESIKALSTSDNSLSPSLNHIGTKTRGKFSGSCPNFTFKKNYNYS